MRDREKGESETERVRQSDRDGREEKKRTREKGGERDG